MGAGKPDVPLSEIGESITRRDVGPMIDGLLVHDRAQPEAWVHRDSRSYLAAVAKVCDDLELLVGPAADSPSWQLFAYVLLAARDYDSE